jgi:hypothetical protein
MDTVTKPDAPADIWDNNVNNLSDWLSQEVAIQQINNHTGLLLELQPNRYGKISENLLEVNDELTFKNLSDQSFIPLVCRLNMTTGSIIETAIHLASISWSKNVILVAPEFSNSELNSLGWLNANSQSNVHFYAFQVEAWKDSTTLNAELDLVAKPSDSMFLEYQHAFWINFAKYELQERQKAETNPELVHDLHPYYTGAGETIYLGSIKSPLNGYAIFDLKNQVIGVGARITGKKKEKYHADLVERKDSIQNVFPSDIKLEFTNEEPYHIWTKLEGADLYNRAKWDEYCEWILKTFGTFQELIPALIHRVP